MRQQRGSFSVGAQGSPSGPGQSGGNGMGRSVAIKMLQPMHPGPGASENTLAAYKAGQSKWERDPPQYACKAYCTARQELNILIHLKVQLDKGIILSSSISIFYTCESIIKINNSKHL